MRLLALAAAALITTGLGAAPALANGRHYDHHHGWHGHRGGWHGHHRTCRTHWYHHHRVRRCY